jgi:hypothetical protein
VRILNVLGCITLTGSDCCACIAPCAAAVAPTPAIPTAAGCGPGPHRGLRSMLATLGEARSPWFGRGSGGTCRGGRRALIGSRRVAPLAAAAVAPCVSGTLPAPGRSHCLCLPASRLRARAQSYWDEFNFGREMVDVDCAWFSGGTMGCFWGQANYGRAVCDFCCVLGWIGCFSRFLHGTGGRIVVTPFGEVREQRR